MSFPAPSETFATQDVRVLRQHAIDIEVHALRTAHREARGMLEERGLADLPVHHNGFIPTLCGLLAMARRYGDALATLRWIWRHNRHRRSYLLRSLALLPRAFDILADLERNTPDVLHIFWGHYPSLVGYLVQKRLPRTAVVLCLNAYDLEMELPGSAEVARSADVVRTHAAVNVERVAGFAGIEPTSIEVIYNGVDLVRLDALIERRTKVPRRIVTVGRLVEEKGMFDALEAFARLRKGPWGDATLQMLGDGDALPALRRRAAALGVASAVDFPGHVSHEQVIEALAEAEILLLLTKARGERLPNVVKEGMACRCISVTTPTPGLEELMVDRRHGFVVPAGNPEAAANVMHEVFAGRVDIAAMQREARAHIEERFDLHRTTERYVELWKAASAARQYPGAS